VDADGTAPARVRIRSLLERGRLRRSGGDPEASVEPFAAAWELASAFGEDGLAVDEAHMLAIVDAPPGSDAWHARALALAEGGTRVLVMDADRAGELTSLLLPDNPHPDGIAQALTGERGAYRLLKPVEGLEIPATAKAILAARIDRLAPEDKRLLQAASVIGKDVPFALLQAVADESEGRLRQGLAQLQAGEFLYEARLFPDLEYTFKHALTHDVSYQSLLHDRRRDEPVRHTVPTEHLC